MYHVAGFLFDEKIHDAKCKPRWVWGDVSKLPAEASVITEDEHLLGLKRGQRETKE
jgi:hypothetical protein